MKIYCPCCNSYLFENPQQDKPEKLWSFFPLLNPQVDHDPRQPAYIATQGPLPHTVADFWQVSKIFPLLFLLSASFFFCLTHNLMDLLAVLGTN